MAGHQKTLIVGGSSGIGEAAAAAFVAAGHAVVIASRAGDKLAAAQSRLGDVTTLQVDAADDASVADMMKSVGALDHLVLTPGSGIPMGPFAEIGPKALATAFAAKLLAQARVAAAAIPYLAEGGSITFTGGVVGQKPMPGMVAAGVANMGLEALTRLLAIEIAPRRVNIVVPGLIDTPAYAGMPEAHRAAFFAGASKSLPAGRVGQPADIGGAILSVATNGFMTGATVVIGGGGHL